MPMQFLRFLLWLSFDTMAQLPCNDSYCGPAPIQILIGIQVCRFCLCLEGSRQTQCLQTPLRKLFWSLRTLYSHGPSIAAEYITLRSSCDCEGSYTICNIRGHHKRRATVCQAFPSRKWRGPRAHRSGVSGPCGSLSCEFRRAF